METWLTYLAALLMAEATAFTFFYSGTLAASLTSITSWISGIATIMFLPMAFITFSSGVASLKKDKLGGRSLGITVLWSLLTTVVLSMVAVAVTIFFPTVFPVTSSAGGDTTLLLSEHVAAFDPMGFVGLASSLLIPVLVIAWVIGASLKPSSDIIRPAYTVLNSSSEAMYRIQRTATYFGGCYVYLAGTAAFLRIWQEKTIVVAPSLFLTIGAATAAVLLLVLPLLYAIFTGFRKNPYGILLRSFASLAMGFVSSNIIASSMVNESVSRSNLGVQKRISSTVTPISIIIGRGGTAFISLLATVTLLTTLGAELDLFTLIAIAICIAVFSFTSCASAGFEVLAVSVATLRFFNVNTYGGEAAIIALLPFLNGLAVLLDSFISNMASSIVSVRTKTDVKIPLKDTI